MEGKQQQQATRGSLLHEEKYLARHRRLFAAPKSANTLVSVPVLRDTSAMERAVLLCVVLLLPGLPAERQRGNEEIDSMLSQLSKCLFVLHDVG